MHEHRHHHQCLVKNKMIPWEGIIIYGCFVTDWYSLSFLVDWPPLEFIISYEAFPHFINVTWKQVYLFCSWLLTFKTSSWKWQSFKKQTKTWWWSSESVVSAMKLGLILSFKPHSHFPNTSCQHFSLERENESWNCLLNSLVLIMIVIPKPSGIL